MNVFMPDGSKLDVKNGASVYDCAAKIDAELAKAAIAGKVDGQLIDLNLPVREGAIIKIITSNSSEALSILRHSCAHIMAEALQILYPGVQIAYGPDTKDGFYYDFLTEKPISSSDLKKIEDEMAKIIMADQPFERKVVTKEEAKKVFNDQKFKLEHIDEISEDVDISIYAHGDFADLCKGPHIPRAGIVGAFKLMKVAGAYWRGDSKYEQLTRIYGTAFFKKKGLEEYLTRLKEAEKRDHRKLGRELEIYTTDQMAGVGLPLYLPKGARLMRALQEWLRRDLYKRGYKEVITPHVYNSDVWRTSGHYDFYKDNMYFFNINESSGENPQLVEYAVKPMNCPGHVMIYKSQQHSYRDLPLRYFEFGTVYRHEMSGVLHGLLRTRSFTQDDAHVFCMREQVVEEVVGMLELVRRIMSTFGFDYEAEISTRPAKSIGTDDMWEHATDSLKTALDRLNREYTINEGDGAFYGPKIDIKVKDAIERTWQCSTIQVDFNMPERFALTYRSEDNIKERPWMLHRAIFGSMERFVGILLEHYAGALPLWLAPVQVILLPIADRHQDACNELAKKITLVGGRAEAMEQNEPMRVKIAKAQAKKAPYMIVIGDKEIKSGNLSVRKLNGEQIIMSQDELLGEIEEACI
ncbi:MAG: threonine--tRNA ligase [Eggerthellaceae bacterium]|nr:threonine--tRNA ligase [Eggerthellaceae bacterium]